MIDHLLFAPEDLPTQKTADMKTTDFKMVGPVRFELTTSCTPCKRATRLRYGPNNEEWATKPDRMPRSKRFFDPII